MNEGTRGQADNNLLSKLSTAPANKYALYIVLFLDILGYLVVSVFSENVAVPGEPSKNTEKINFT